MRWLTIAATLAVLALALAVAGCGGGDDEASDDPETVITDTLTDTSTTDETTTDETTDDTDTDTDTGTGFDFASEECQSLLNVGAAFSQAITAATTGTDISGEAEAFQDLAENVPDEIKDDVQVLAGVYAKYADAFADIDIQPGQTPSAAQLAQISQAFSGIDTEEASAASERIGTWAQENCSTG